MEKFTAQVKREIESVVFLFVFCRPGPPPRLVADHLNRQRLDLQVRIQWFFIHPAILFEFELNQSSDGPK